MGGWYLQPDCNMPSGESFARQMLIGREYFREKFGVEPTTAINFDPFGHNRGLVQIMRKAGYDSYLFCRPMQNDCELPSDDFTWVGFDGSEITGHRASTFYNAPLGKAHEKIEKWIADNKGKSVGLVLWGVGNHGGGPSRIDLNRIAELKKGCADFELIHSTPEQYFNELRESGSPLPRHEDDINPWAPGCYTSQARIKQRHRLLENVLYQTEKMAAAAALFSLLEYPREDLMESLRDLLVAEFHDILPGSSIQPVEDAGLRLMDHALEILSRLRARTFFALASGQPKAPEGKIPVMVYNPHPFPVRAVIECEFQLPDFEWGEQFTIPIVERNGEDLPCQTEQERGNLNIDWRKRSVFVAELAPSQMNRFDCRMKVLPARPKPELKKKNGLFTFKTDDLEFVLNAKTGLIEKLAVAGFDYVTPGAFKLLVIADNEDPWEARYQSFRNVIGEFKLMSRAEGARFSGVGVKALDSVRVIEDGPVRTVIEALFQYGDSFAIIHYKLPKQGSEIETFLRVHWCEKSKFLKLSIPTTFEDAAYRGQVAYGVQKFPTTGREVAAQKWVAVTSDKSGNALTCVNAGTYGSDFADGELRLSLLRGPAYSALPMFERPLVRQDRYSPRIDQGERLFSFWFNAGPISERLEKIDREALFLNERPFALSFFPSGAGEALPPCLTLSDGAAQLCAFKKAQDGDGYVIRLFEPTGVARKTTLAIPSLEFEQEIELGAFEIKTFRFDPQKKLLRETNILERDI
jgi:alpha-mannosidase